MIKKYFTTTLRHLWRYRLFTILNILGLAVSISASWIIFRIISFEFSYDTGLANKDRIYRVVTAFVFDEKEQYNGGVSKPLYQGVKEQIAGLDYVVPVFGIYMEMIQVDNGNSKPVVFNDPDPSLVVATDSSYFTMLPYKWISGNKSTALLAPKSVVLTESRAKIYFPGKKPDEIIHQTITYYTYRDTVQRTITGIVADYAAPSEFTAQEFCSLPTKAYELSQWTNTNGSDKLYLQLKRSTDPGKVVAQIDRISAQKRRTFEQQKNLGFKYKQWYELLPLKESHFSTYIEEQTRKADKKILFGLAGIALFLLILAGINYINICVASMPQRAKEIGVRKTLGSSQAQLIGQFLVETLFTTFLAALLSLFLSRFGFWILRDIIPLGIKPLGDSLQLIIFIIILGVAVTVLAGIYPGWLITKVRTVNVFRNSYFSQKGGKGFSLKKTLIVFQFVIALVFITSAIIVGKQLHYALTSDMGFDKDAVVLLNVPSKYASEKNYQGKQFLLLNELKMNAGIKGISLGNEPMSSGYSSSQYEYVKEGREPIKRQVFRKTVDTAYLDLYGMKLLAGRNLQPSDTTNEYVINETAVHAFGFASPQDAIGKMIGQSNEKFPIVGVVKDFYLRNFYNTIDPMAFESGKDNLFTFNIKLENNRSQWGATLKAIEKKWYQFYPPETFSYKFYDETIEEMYKGERNLAKLINIATCIAILISCLGLFGLAVLSAFQRTKEIGIRKVLGASVSTIVQLLSKEYIVLVLIAIIVASPIAWWVMNKWLQHFAYRIEVKWWMFVLAGFIAVVIAMTTVSFQAIKAAIANPVKSLRTE